MYHPDLGINRHHTVLLPWFTARLLVGRKFAPDLIGECADEAFGVAVVTWLPRMLGSNR